MSPLAHLSSGYLVYKLNYKNKILKPKLILSLSLIGSIIPDLDGLFGNNINIHRYTIFHAPLFWTLIFLIILIISNVKNYRQIILGSTFFYISVLFHLLLDYISGRTAGIMILYPFSNKIYSLFLLSPEKGNIPFAFNKDFLNFWKFYIQNKLLIITEFFVIFIGFLIFSSSIFKKKLNNQLD